MPPVDDDDVRWLLKLLEVEGLSDLEVSQGEVRVLVRAYPPNGTAAEAGFAASDNEDEPPAGTPVLAPMAGTFYRTPSPNAEPFVEEGDWIERGTVVGLIEAMKLFNDVNCPVTGVITKISLENEERVVAGQSLMWVEPVGSESSSD